MRSSLRHGRQRSLARASWRRTRPTRRSQARTSHTRHGVGRQWARGRRTRNGTGVTRSGSNSFPRTNKRSSWVSSPAAEVESSSRSRSSLRAVRWAFRWIGAERQSDRTEACAPARLRSATSVPTGRCCSPPTVLTTTSSGLGLSTSQRPPQQSDGAGTPTRWANSTPRNRSTIFSHLRMLPRSPLPADLLNLRRIILEIGLRGQHFCSFNDATRNVIVLLAGVLRARALSSLQLKKLLMKPWKLID